MKTLFFTFMLTPQTVVLLSRLGLQMDRITFNGTSTEVVVGVRNSQGDRFIGRVERKHDATASLQEAFERAMDEYDRTWREL